MALANLQNDLFSSNPPSNAASGQKANLVAAHAAIVSAVSRWAGQNERRDDLPDGYHAKVQVSIAAKVEGVNEIYRKGFTVDLSVGHSSTRASSSNPSLPKLIGLIMAKLNEQTREAILRDLPEIFASNGGELPEVDSAIATAVDGMMKKLRASKPQTVRGSVTGEVREDAPSLAIVG